MSTIKQINIPQFSGKSTSLIVIAGIVLFIFATSWENTPGGYEGFQFVKYGANKGIRRRSMVKDVTSFGPGTSLLP